LIQAIRKAIKWLRDLLRGIVLKIDRNGDGKPDVEIILDKQGNVINERSIRE
jgi:hypothetical protein